MGMGIENWVAAALVLLVMGFVAILVLGEVADFSERANMAREVRVSHSKVDMRDSEWCPKERWEATLRKIQNDRMAAEEYEFFHASTISEKENVNTEVVDSYEDEYVIDKAYDI